MLALGILISRKAPRKKNIYAREGFAIVALSWLLISLLGAIPFCLTGEIPSYVDAVFETVSGFYNNRIFDFIQCGGIKPYKFILAKLYTLGWRNGILVFVIAFIPIASGRSLHILSS